ncbi:MAG: hypothetical protein EOP34_03515 [Rickettsiales bacterium]|nr:MAG: hypothetical protein EOP34_03515 [Rickettsiales bacterium]
MVQGSGISPLICNFVINSCLLKRNSNITKTNNLSIFGGIKSSFRNSNGKIMRCVRHLICYADDIVITTNNKFELDDLVSRVKIALTYWNLSLAEEKSIIIKYNAEQSVLFDYFGFTFNYIPKSKVKYGGIIKQGKTLSHRLAVKSQGTHIIYPSNKSYIKIKSTLKDIIDSLSREGVSDVINKCNNVIRG